MHPILKVTEENSAGVFHLCDKDKQFCKQKKEQREISFDEPFSEEYLRCFEFKEKSKLKVLKAISCDLASNENQKGRSIVVFSTNKGVFGLINLH